MTRASRAKRLAVKAITGSKKALRKAAKLERGVFGAYIQGLIELAQAYGHRDAEGCYRAAPYTTEQLVALDEYYAAAWNRYVEKHHPDLDAQAVVFGPRDAGGTQLVPRDKSQHGRVVHRGRMSSVPLEAVKGHGVVFHFDLPADAVAKTPQRVRWLRVPDLTAAEFGKLTMIYLYAEATRVDPAAFRAGANLAWQATLRHTVAGKRANDDLAGRDRLDDLADDQATDFWRRIQRVRRDVDKQVRAEPNDYVCAAAPFSTDPDGNDH